MAMVPFAASAADGGMRMTPDQLKAADLCEAVGGDDVICIMRHASEAAAVDIAVATVKLCKENREAVIEPHKNLNYRADIERRCGGWLPYIKQRWGY
jgi:hypothetical protein